MKTTLSDRTDSSVNLHVVLDEDQIKHAVKHVYDEMRPRVKAAGFRPGKAPDMIVEREMGAGVIQGEVIEHAVQDAYGEAVKAEKLQVVAPPRVSVEKFVPYTTIEFKAEIQLMPKVDLPKYQDYRIKRDAVTIDPAEIEQAVEDLRRKEASRVDAARPAAIGDEVNFDFTGTKDGQPVRGASANGQTLQLGSGQFIPGFEDEMVGLKVGDEKTFDITFPSEYHEASLAGQVVTFAIKINKITELVLPELNDDFAPKVGPFSTVDELRADLGEQMANRKAQESERSYEQKVLDQLVSDVKVSPPPALVDQQLDRLKEELEQNLAYSGLNLEKYQDLSGKTAEQMDAEMRPEAEKRVKLAMVLTEISAAEKIVVTPAEVDAEIERMRGEYKDAATRSQLEDDSTRDEIFNHLMASRVVAKLVGYAQMTDKPAKPSSKKAD